MGAGAGALRRNMGHYDTIERHVRLDRYAWMGTNAPWTIITVSRIPAIEIEMIEPAAPSDTSFDYDEDYEDDYEMEAAAPEDESGESESWEWFTNTRGGGNGDFNFDWIPDFETTSDSD